MAETTYTWVVLNDLRRMSDNFGIGDTEEASIELAARDGDNWTQSIREKHGENAHTDEVLRSYATKYAALSVCRGRFGSRVTAADMPAFVTMLENDIKAFAEGGVSKWTRGTIKSGAIERGVIENYRDLSEAT